MILNPPLRRNDIEVTSINSGAKTVSMVVYMPTHSQMQVHTPETHSFIQHKVNGIMLYLEAEGYIESNNNWIIHTGIVVSTP